ncbi:calcium/sodium antiporter [Haloparvum alkalitolerans]|uniref:sodium:calcium antiporter n=1 Tax=Haloparvum alkalitolerans TaxID=1042953 RepID=UPI003CF9842C
MSLHAAVAAVAGGLALLVAGSDRTVAAAGTLADRIGFSTFLVGVTVVAVGTSLPEIATAAYAAAYGVGSLAVGHIAGSATAQITLGIGLVAVVASFEVARENVRRYGGGMLAAMTVMLVAVGSGDVSRIEGVAMAALYVGFLSRRVDAEVYVERAPGTEETETVAHPVAWLLVGLAAVAVGGHLLVTGSRELAATLGVSAHALGLLTGMGTTFPEVAVALAAVRRGRGDIAGGTLLGSNITDPLFSLGVGAAVGGITLGDPRTATLATAYMLVASAVVVALLYRRESLTRLHGVGCILLYLPLVAV